MDSLVNCDRCSSRFNELEHLPKLFPCCGNTVCLKCVKSNTDKTSGKSKCDQCGKEFENSDLIITNTKLLKVVQQIYSQAPAAQAHPNGTGTFQPNFNNSFSGNGRPQQLPPQNISAQPKDKINLDSEEPFPRCMVHRHKELEFYCRTCSQLVCSNCMFYEHNGHSLSQLEEVNCLLMNNVNDLSKLLQKARTIVNLNRSQFEKLLSQVQFLEDQQMENIEKGFQAVIQRLQEKKQAQMAELTTKYASEKRKFQLQMKDVLRSDDFLRDIEDSYGQLVSYMEENSQCKVLVRINEINEFVSTSILKVDEVLKQKKEFNFKLDSTLTPMTLNVHRALEAIGKFHMNHPLSNEGTFLKITRQANTDSEEDRPAQRRQQFPDLLIKKNKLPPSQNSFNSIKASHSGVTLKRNDYLKLQENLDNMHRVKSSLMQIDQQTSSQQQQRPAASSTEDYDVGQDNEEFKNDNFSLIRNIQNKNLSALLANQSCQSISESKLGSTKNSKPQTPMVDFINN